MPAAAQVTFDVLGEPTRRQILDLLREVERPVNELVDALGASQPAVSKHLRVLRDAGFVRVRIDAQRRLYRVEPEPLRELDAWLAPFRALWSTALDDLEAHLDRSTGSPASVTGPKAGRTAPERSAATKPGSGPKRRQGPTAVLPATSTTATAPSATPTTATPTGRSR